MLVAVCQFSSFFPSCFRCLNVQTLGTSCQFQCLLSTLWQFQLLQHQMRAHRKCHPRFGVLNRICLGKKLLKEDLAEALNNMKNEKTLGIDSHPCEVLKKCGRLLFMICCAWLKKCLAPTQWGNFKTKG